MMMLLKRFLWRYLPVPLIARPLSQLQPERLYLWLDALWQRRHLSGAVVEVGCYMAGTAILAHRMLKRTGFAKPYIAIDTFNGFIPHQFDADTKHGTPKMHADHFRRNSFDIVRRITQYYGAEEILLIEADICTCSDAVIPEQIIAYLIDVDLESPTYEGLRRVWPRLVIGGVVLVDDCALGSSWSGARRGYERFVAEVGLVPNYAMGMGIVEKLPCV